MASASPLKSWIPLDPKTPFSMANIPFGIISHPFDSSPHAAVAIGDFALDLKVLASKNAFSGLQTKWDPTDVFSQPSLNAFAALGQPEHRRVRRYIQDLLSADSPFPHLLKDNSTLQQESLMPLSRATTHLPLQIGDYTDFYVGLNHAYNVGVLFRGPTNALQPNYKHLPVGYHGRASSIVPTGTPIRRPRGQILANPTADPKVPIFSPSRKLDIELELAAFVCTPNEQGSPVPISDAASHLFGLVLMNDWSARDIQAWEYVPLGPFNSKNFATTISPWVVLMDALEPFRAEGLAATDGGDVLDYLKEARKDTSYDIELTVELSTAAKTKTATTISRSNAKNLLFSFPQMLAHHTVGGCNMRTGDLLGSGTISGKDEGSMGSMLEQTRNGKERIKLVDGSERVFLEDGDEVVMRGVSGSEGALVGFGECRGMILPAL